MGISEFLRVLAIHIIWLILAPFKADAIGCFVCTSLNGGNNGCEDTFNNTANYYRQDCKAIREGRTGLFPATQCIKMKAEDSSAGFRLIVRDCVVDNGGTNSETEIGRQSHCGWMRVIKYNGRRMQGCILTCDKDGCNGANFRSRRHALIVILTIILINMAIKYCF